MWLLHQKYRLWLDNSFRNSAGALTKWELYTMLCGPEWLGKFLEGQSSMWIFGEVVRSTFGKVDWLENSVDIRKGDH